MSDDNRQPCTQCGKYISDTYNYCPFCAYPLTDTEEGPDEYRVESAFQKLISQKRRSKDEQKRAESGFWDKIKDVGRNIPFIKEAVALYFMVKDPEVPLHKKSAAIGAILYFITPFDIIPDFIPVAGMLDDAAIIMKVIQYYRKIITPYMVQAEQWLNETK